MSQAENDSPFRIVEELERLRTEGTICSWEIKSTTGEMAEMEVWIIDGNNPHQKPSEQDRYTYISLSQRCGPGAFAKMLQDLLLKVTEEQDS